MILDNLGSVDPQLGFMDDDLRIGCWETVDFPWYLLLREDRPFTDYHGQFVVRGQSVRTKEKLLYSWKLD